MAIAAVVSGSVLAAREASAQGPLTNGGHHEASIGAPAELDEWTFSADQGDAIVVSIGEVFPDETDPNFVPWIRLYRPDGVLSTQNWGAVATQVSATAGLSGTWRVVIGSHTVTTTGHYQLTLTRVPGAFIVPPGDQGGPLTNGGNHPGEIHLGDLDMWSFTANQGDAIVVSIGEVFPDETDPGFVPWIRLYRPDGALSAQNWGALATQVSATAGLSGTWTVVVGSHTVSTTGHYLLTLARTPGAFVVPTGDQGGALANGNNHPGEIHLGDLDMWSFTANQGDAIVVSIGEVFPDETDPGFVPWIRLYRPDGALSAQNWGALATQVSATAGLSGTWTVVVGSHTVSTTGHYLLALARTPGAFVVPTGDQGGALANGNNHPGEIHLGDLDMWSFTANQGDAIVVSIGEVFPDETDPGFVPWIRLYRPDGALSAQNWGALATQVSATAGLSGTWTVVVGSHTVSTTGHYLLTLAHVPGALTVPTDDEGGALTNALTVAGRIHLGDLDLWTFHAALGSPLSISIAEVVEGEIDPNFVPWIRLYRPDGTFVAQNWGALSARIDVNAPLTGLYTVVVGSHTVSTGGAYTVTVLGAMEAPPPPPIVVTPSAGPGGSISPATPQTVVSGATVTFTLTPDTGYEIAGTGGTCGGTRSGTTFTTAPVTVSCSVAVAFTLGVTESDADGDGLDDDWERRFGLDPGSSTGDNGATGDPDGDGRTNAEELTDGTHPRGFVITYFAEGASSAFFATRLALANPSHSLAHVLVRYQKGTGETVAQDVLLPARTRTTIDVGTVPGLASAEYATLVESDVQIVADRTMTWDGRGYGGHAERGVVAQSATTWYFAEGATHSGFELFYLVQNPTTQQAQVRVTYLRPAPQPPLVKTYLVAPQARFNVWVNNEARVDPTLAPLAATDVSAIVESIGGQPIVVERAMYRHVAGLVFGAGHESAGSTALSTTWFFAEGATGPFFDLFLLIGNPSDTDAVVDARYLLPSGQVLTKRYAVPARSRFNIWVDHEDAALADTAVSTTLTSVNGVAIVAERAMWWPGQELAPSWHEAHNSPGSTASGTLWALAEGETGPAGGWETYVLVANTSDFDGQVAVTVLFEDGTEATRTFALTANSRFNVAMTAMFPETQGRRYGVVVESLGDVPVQLVVERAMYRDALGLRWAAGTNALATRLQ